MAIDLPVSYYAHKRQHNLHYVTHRVEPVDALDQQQTEPNNKKKEDKNISQHQLTPIQLSIYISTSLRVHHHLLFKSGLWCILDRHDVKLISHMPKHRREI